MGIYVNRLSLCLLLTTLLLPVPIAVWAAPPAASAGNNSQSWYDVELIVFRYSDPDAGNLETWPANPGRPDWMQAKPLVTPAAGSAGNQGNTSLLPLEQIQGHQLDNDWARLEKTSGYQPLLHVAWEQPLEDHSTAPTIQIGTPPAPEQVPSGTSVSQPAGAAVATPGPSPAPDSMAPAGAVAAAASPTQVYGTVKFSQYGPYLHFDVDLACQGPLARNVMRVPGQLTATVPEAASISAPGPAAIPLATAQPTVPAIQWYRMTQDRRIEAGRLNYFDNPMFGVLVLVTPHPVTSAPLH